MTFNMNKDIMTEVDSVNKEEWSELLWEFDDATIYQTWSYASIMYGPDNVSHIILKKNNNIIAIAQTGIRYFPQLGTATANVHWGPLWHKKNTPATQDNFDKILKAIVNEYGIKRGFLLRIWPFQFENDDRSIKTVLRRNKLTLNSLAPSYRTLRLNLKPRIEDLRKNLDQKWRNQLNRAEKTPFVITEGSDDTLFKTFMRLQGEMYNRKKYSTGVNYEQYRLINSDLPASQKMNIMVCKYENEPVAVSICSAIGDTGIYLLGATGNKGMRLNGSNLLQWQMIKWLQKRGCSYYDLGGIDPESNPGVYHFKCGIAGKAGTDEKFIGQYIFHNNIQSHLLNIVIQTTNKFKEILKSARKSPILKNIQSRLPEYKK